jgi:hypothetical protein
LVGLADFAQVFPCSSLTIQFDVVIGIGGLALVGATFSVRMRELPFLMRVVFVSLFTFFGVYLAFPPTLPSDVSFTTIVGLLIHYGHWILPALCVAGFWRPAFGVFAMLCAIWERLILNRVFDVSLSQTEYFPVCEFALFMLISAAFFNGIKRFKIFSYLFITPARPNAITPLEKIALCAVAVHMSNYFYSGVKKSLLGDNPLSWVIDNQTHFLMLSANAMGLLPLKVVPDLAEAFFHSFEGVRMICNFLVLGGELAAVVAVLRIRWLVYILIFYNILHIIIFLTTGILFSKWIMLNFSIIAGLFTMRHKVLPSAFKLQLIGIVVAAPLIFWVANLGWWDSRAFNHERFYAVLDNGLEIEVPTNYWGSLSVNYAQARVTRDKADGFFPTGTAGIVFGQRNMELANRCDYQFEPEMSARVLRQLVEAPGSHVIRNVLLHHRYVLEHVNSKGHIAYDFYPHHIWSMPWLFSDFNALDKRRILAYRYVVEAACLDFQEGRFTRKVMIQADYVIKVK